MRTIVTSFVCFMLLAILSQPANGTEKDSEPVEQTCKAARDLGCRSVELVPPDQWPLLKTYGLICALTPSHLFVRGMNNRNHWDECLTKMRKAIDDSADAGFPNVITFTGYAPDGQDLAAFGDRIEFFAVTLVPIFSAKCGLHNTVLGFKQRTGKS